MANDIERTFDLGRVLTITTGILFTEMNNLYGMLDFLAGYRTYTHEFSKVMEVARSYILAKYPQLVGVGQNVQFTSISDVKEFLAAQKAILGDSFVLSPIPKELYEQPEGVEKQTVESSSKVR